VKDDFRAALFAKAALTRDARDAFDARIGFNPWFFWRDGVAFIEHGHQYDPFCATPHVMAPVSPLDPRRIVHSFCEVLIRFVVRPTRGMSESGHENVGLGYYLRFAAQLGLSGMAALGLRFARAVRELFALQRASVSKAAHVLRAEHDKHVTKLATVTRIGVDKLRALLALQVQPVTSSIRGIMGSVLLDRLALALTAMITIVTLAIVAIAGLHVDAGLACLAVIALWVVFHRVLSRARTVDPAAQMVDRATKLAKLFPAAFIVMGHTHIPTTTRAGDATYINVGSWAEHEAEPERAARTHLVIHVRPQGAEAHFCAWEPTGPRRLPTT
jgi:hypothetical protein